MKKRITIFTIITILACATLCGVFISKSTTSASALNISEINELCKEYTDTITPNGVNINDYINEFKEYTEKRYETPSGLSLPELAKGTYFQNSTIFKKSPSPGLRATIDGDDNITKIVPKELFKYENEKIYIGDAYGFYINTVQKQHGGQAYFESTVILINVIRERQDDYAFSVKIQPMVQIDYCCVTTNGQYVPFKKYYSEDYEGTCYMVFNGNITNAVIPMIKNGVDYKYGGTEYFFMQHKESASFSLSDISFVSRVYNNNALNYGDDGYNANNDYGYFFNGNTYEYSATLKKSNGSVETGVKEIASDAIDTTIGLLDIEDSVTEIIGEEVAGAFGNVFDILGFIVRTTNAIQSMYSEIKYNVTNKNYYYPEEIFPPTPQGQIAKYGALLKCNSMIINSGEDRLLFESGDYAKGTFKLSKSNGSKEYSSLFIDIVAKVVDNRVGHDSVKCVIANTNVIKINDPEIKNINLFENNSGYILPGLEQKFKFTPQYSGTYIIDLPQNINFEIKNGNSNVNYERNGNKISVNLKGGVLYNLNFSNNGQNRAFNFSVGVDEIAFNETKSINIGANEKYIIEFNSSATEVYKFAASNSSVRISILNSNLLYIKDSALNTVYQPAINGERFYILLTNTTGSAINTNLTVSFPQTLNENQQYNESIGTEFIYYKFIATKSGYYTVVSDYGSGIFSTDFLPSMNLNLSTPFDSVAAGCTVTNIYLQKGQAFYLGFKMNSAKNINIKFAKAENTYQWVTGSGSGEKVIQGNTLKIPRGSSQIVRLKVNGYYFDNATYNLTSYTGGYSYSNGTLTISSSKALFDGDNALILSVADKSELIPLYIRVTYELQPIFEAYSNSALDYGIKWTTSLSNLSTDTKIWISLKLTYKDGSNCSQEFLVSRTPGHIDLSNFGYSSKFQVDIIKLTIYNSVTRTEVDIFANDRNQVHNINVETLTVRITPDFSGGVGTATDPFLISTIGDFNAIAEIASISSRSFYYKQTADLYFNGSHNLHTVKFYGTYDGNSKWMYNISYYIAAVPIHGDVFGGIFKENFGTIKNLYVKGLSITSSNSLPTSGILTVGGIVGNNYGLLENITLRDPKIDVKHRNAEVGGVAGYNVGITSYPATTIGGRKYNINNCEIIGPNTNIRSRGDTGGIVGHNSGNIYGCDAGNSYYLELWTHVTLDQIGAINRALGGIAGVNYSGFIVNCNNNANISYASPADSSSGITPYIGKIVGINYGGLSRLIGCSYGGAISTGSLYSYQKTYVGTGNQAIGQSNP